MKYCFPFSRISELNAMSRYNIHTKIMGVWTTAIADVQDDDKLTKNENGSYFKALKPQVTHGTQNKRDTD